MSSFKSSENIQRKEGGPDISVSDNQSSSVTLNELAIKARKRPGTDAIRTKVLPSKPKWEIIKITISQNTNGKENISYRGLSGQMLV